MGPKRGSQMGIWMASYRDLDLQKVVQTPKMMKKPVFDPFLDPSERVSGGSILRSIMQKKHGCICGVPLVFRISGLDHFWDPFWTLFGTPWNHQIDRFYHIKMIQKCHFGVSQNSLKMVFFQKCQKWPFLGSWPLFDPFLSQKWSKMTHFHWFWPPKTLQNGQKPQNRVFPGMTHVLTRGTPFWDPLKSGLFKFRAIFPLEETRMAQKGGPKRGPKWPLFDPFLPLFTHFGPLLGMWVGPNP